MQSFQLIDDLPLFTLGPEDFYLDELRTTISRLELNVKIPGFCYPYSVSIRVFLHVFPPFTIVLENFPDFPDPSN